MALLIFDLDGTLVETTQLSIPLIQAEVKRYPHLKMPEPKAIQSVFGLPKKEFWETLIPDGNDKEILDIQSGWEVKLLEMMNEQDVLLPHVKEVLSALKQMGHRLTTASNCSTAYLERILESQGIMDYFDNPLCIELVQGRKKEEILKAHFTVLPKQGAYMVGDRSSDIEAAHANGIPAIACHFGFAEEGELEEAEYHIHSLLDLLELFPE
ncbi:HAD family hydrolase [Pradoshia sp.]